MKLKANKKKKLAEKNSSNYRNIDEHSSDERLNNVYNFSTFPKQS
jgi:hypothetical protein